MDALRSVFNFLAFLSLLFFVTIFTGPVGFVIVCCIAVVTAHNSKQDKILKALRK